MAKGQKGPRDEGASFIIYKSQLAMRVLDVVEVLGVLDFPALLALKGRQNTDGGERSVTPGQLPHPPPSPSLAPTAQGGGGFYCNP